ncbi:MAG: hypothetical protein NT154_21145 [Verrucomicrobia bacterium]|nr:hypothetical protein [Verrucomicrobiota bacterium]
MLFYFAAPTAAAADRITARGFLASDGITVKLFYGNPKFINQPGILVSTELDPRTSFAVEIDTTPNPRYLIRHELVSPVPGVRYYVLLQDFANQGTRRAIPPSEIQAVRAAGLYKWRKPLLWYGKDREPVKGTVLRPSAPSPIRWPRTRLPDYLPPEFRFVLAQCSGPGCIVEFIAGQLCYDSSQWVACCNPKPLPSPSVLEWRRFWAALRIAGVWRWAPSYEAEDITVGRFWSLKLCHAGRSVESRGANAFPGADGPDFPETCSFAKFLHALCQLCGLIAIG